MEDKILKLAKALRSAAYWIDDGYYLDEAERAANNAKRSIYEEIANSIDNAFEIDSNMTREEIIKGYK